jgi:hypothetical protein
MGANGLTNLLRGGGLKLSDPRGLLDSDLEIQGWLVVVFWPFLVFTLFGWREYGQKRAKI